MEVEEEEKDDDDDSKALSSLPKTLHVQNRQINMCTCVKQSLFAGRQHRRCIIPQAVNTV